MKLTSEQKSFLNEVVKGKWTINPDTGLVDVSGDVDMSMMDISEIPTKFGEVTGYFHCYRNQLNSLVGAPESVGGDFLCSHNRLTSLKGSPQSVEGGFYCHVNQLTSLEGAPQSVGSEFYCNHNKLTSLKGSPRSVGGDFYCKNNQLTSLKGAPQSIGKFFYIDLSDIDKNYYHVIIPEMEELISRGVNLHNPDEYYYPYRKIHYTNKLIELL
jgi:hypothetical protein